MHSWSWRFTPAGRKIVVFPCCGRQDAVQGSSGFGICVNCESSIYFRKWRESKFSSDLSSRAVSALDVLSLVTNNLKIISRRVSRGDTLTLCEAVVGADQCSFYAKGIRDGHHVCKVHMKRRKNNEYISEKPGAPWLVSVMIHLLKHDEKLRLDAEMSGLVYTNAAD